MLKKILYVFLAVIVILQFIRPSRNQAAGPFPNDINTKFAMTDDVMSAIKTSCYNCHSNNTNYPWYANIQPIAWWLQNHVNEGKKELNFSEFATYTVKRQTKKFKEIEEQITEGEMPLPNYTRIHKNAVLTEQQKEAIKKWCAESLAHLPPVDPANQTDNKREEAKK